MRRLALVAVVAWLALAVQLVPAARAAAPAAGHAPRALVVPVRGTIDLSTVPFVERALREAERDGDDLVVLELDTHGGRLDAAVAIRDIVLRSHVHTAALVRPRAISAGALIALSAETLALAPGSTMGAATPVRLHLDGPSAVTDEKTLSYVRKEFAATAAQRGRRADVAEAMVDPDVAIAGVVERGKLLTLTHDEAIALGMAIHAADVPALLEALGLGDAEVRPLRPNWAEHAVRIVTNPIVSALLMTLGMVGLLVELRAPGFGVPGLVGLVCLGLFFGGHWIAHLAGFEELALLGVGLALLAIELVVPGFGAPGVLGIIAVVAALAMSLVGGGATGSAILASLARATVSVAAAGVLLFLVLALLPRRALAGDLVLTSALGPGTDADRTERSWLGARGTALTALRPSGTALVDGERLDVVADGEFVPRGADVEIVRREGARIVVHRAPEAPARRETP